MNYKTSAIDAGLYIAFKEGIEAVTLQSVAEIMGASRQAVGHHYSVDALREAVELAAFDRGVVPVMAQAVTGPRSARYPVTPDHLRAISTWIVGGRA